MQAKCSNKEFTQPQGEHFPSKVFTFAPTGLSGPKLATLARTLEKLALRGHGRPRRGSCGPSDLVRQRVFVRIKRTDL